MSKHYLKIPKGSMLLVPIESLSIECSLFAVQIGCGEGGEVVRGHHGGFDKMALPLLTDSIRAHRQRAQVLKHRSLAPGRLTLDSSRQKNNNGVLDRGY